MTIPRLISKRSRSKSSNAFWSTGAKCAKTVSKRTNLWNASKNFCPNSCPKKTGRRKWRTNCSPFFLSKKFRFYKNFKNARQNLTDIHRSTFFQLGPHRLARSSAHTSKKWVKITGEHFPNLRTNNFHISSEMTFFSFFLHVIEKEI